MMAYLLTCIWKPYLAYQYVFHTVDIFDEIMLGKLKKPKPLSSLFTWIWTLELCINLQERISKEFLHLWKSQLFCIPYEWWRVLKKFVWKRYFVTKIVLTYCENCSSDWEKLLKFEAEGQEFAKNLRSLEQFIGTVKGQTKFRNRMFFLTCF